MNLRRTSPMPSSRFHEWNVRRFHRRHQCRCSSIRRDSLAERNLKGKNFAVTFVTVPELDLGILKASNPFAAAKRCAEVLAEVHVLHGSGRTPMFYARIYHDLQQRGQ